MSAVLFDSAEALSINVSPFDTFIQIIDGKAEIMIDEVSNFLNTSQSIIKPAHSSNTIKAKVTFKILSTIIKSGYEDHNLNFIQLNLKKLKYNISEICNFHLSMYKFLKVYSIYICIIKFPKYLILKRHEKRSQKNT